METKNILMVDDSVEMCEEVSEALRDEGYVVSCAHDGLTGSELLGRRKYDVVLLDLKMPGIDGFDVLRRLRQRNDDTKVIIVTAKPLMSDLLKTEGGLDDQDYDALKKADGVVTKPYDMELLLGTIRKVLGESSGDDVTA